MSSGSKRDWYLDRSDNSTTFHTPHRRLPGGSATLHTRLETGSSLTLEHKPGMSSHVTRTTDQSQHMLQRMSAPLPSA